MFNLPICSRLTGNLTSGHGWLSRSLDRRIVLVLLPMLLSLGCGKPAGVLFPPVDPPLVWPAPPEPARIRYVGQLATSADLKPAVSGLESMGRALFGKKSAQSMLSPYAVCTDGKDRLFVADSNAQLLHVFNLRTRRYARWQPAPPDTFAQPVGVAHDPTTGRTFVADSVGGTVHAFDAAGKPLVRTVPGLINRPTGLCFDVERRRLLVVDTAGHCLHVLTPDLQRLTTVGSRGPAPGQFNYPTSVAVDSAGRIYVCDALNFRVQQFSPDLSPTGTIGAKGDLPGYLSTPKVVATDTEDHLYVVDANFENVQIFDHQGRLLLDFGQEGHGPGEFWLPGGLFIDADNRIWIADSYNRRIQVFDYLPEAQP